MTAPVSLAPIASALAPACEQLAGYLGTWASRDASKPQPEVIQAGNDALDAIDALTAELHAVRGQLVAQYRDHQDRVDARISEGLARRHSGGAR